MTLKVGFAQVAAPSSNTTIALTDSTPGFSSDVKAAILFSSAGSVSNVGVTGIGLSMGFCAGATQAGMAHHARDNVASESGRRDQHSDAAYIENAFASVAAQATHSFLSTGVQLSFSISNAEGRLINALLLGGDIEANVVTNVFPGTGSNLLTLAHGLGGMPDVLFFMTTGANGDNGFQAAVDFAFGMYDVANATQAAINLYEANNAGTVNARTALFTTRYLESVAGQGGGVVTSVDATNVNLDHNNATNTMRVYMLAIRSTSGTPIVVKTGTFTTPTSIGASTPITGLAQIPQAIILLPSNLTALNASTLQDTSGGVGLIVNRATPIQVSAMIAADHSVATKANDSMTSSTKPINLLTVATGVPDVEATVTAITTSVEFNYTNINASAFQVGYLALGEIVGDLSRPRRGTMDGGMQNLTGGIVQ